VGRVAILSEELINQIAAGEVVERPASVVKEIAENSIDAGARTIRVALLEGGLSRIEIRDDGGGMSREDARLSVVRHATSKLRDLDGLSAVLTKGFRGEGLSAIAAVSRLTLTTAEEGAKLGTRVRVEGGGLAQIEDAPPAPGTWVEVADLFFNTPARRKFMKRVQTELSHAQDALLRLALSHPEVSFFLEHEGRMLFSSPAASQNLRDRIGAALGPGIEPHLIPLEERQLGISVSGYLASPEVSLPNARGIYTFVNRRYIRDRGLNHAIGRAMQDTLPPGRHPVAVVFLEMDPHSVDVNVHPQKLEVRFAAPRMVYDAVFAALSKAARGEPDPLGSDGILSEPLAGSHYAMAVENFLTRAQEASWGGGLEQVLPKAGINQKPPPGYFSSLRYLGLLGRRFWICEGAGGTLAVIDPHAAAERVAMHSLVRAADPNRKQVLQRSLFTAAIELSAAEISAIVSHREWLEKLGFEIEPFGGNTVVVKSAPAELFIENPAELVRAVATELSGSQCLAPQEAIAQVIACHAGGAPKPTTGHDEAQQLLRRLEEVDFEPRCRHPEVVLFQIPFLELERRAR
jgi:DNA mismatch repair protein MutL